MRAHRFEGVREQLIIMVEPDGRFASRNLCPERQRDGSAGVLRQPVNAHPLLARRSQVEQAFNRVVFRSVVHANPLELPIGLAKERIVHAVEKARRIVTGRNDAD